MDAVLFQPPYPAKGDNVSALRWQSDALAALRPGEVELALLPEYANCMGYADAADLRRTAAGPGAAFARTLRAEAARIGATIFAGLVQEDAAGALHNRLVAFFADGAAPRAVYEKTHLVRPERDKGFVPGDAADTFRLGGVRYGAAICFDSYFPELFARYAAQRPDVLLVASQQRQESGEALLFLNRARAFDTGCTLLRSAPAMPDPDRGGRTMAVAPDGRILADAGGAPGLLRVRFDPAGRFLRPASFDEPDVVRDYRETIQPARRPALYRAPAGSDRAGPARAP